MDQILTGSALATLVLEGIKYIVRFIIKEPDYDFPPLFYVIALPILNALAPFALVYLGILESDPITGFTLPEIIKYLVALVLSSIISSGIYTVGVKPLKNYSRELSAGA